MQQVNELIEILLNISQYLQNILSNKRQKIVECNSGIRGVWGERRGWVMEREGAGEGIWGGRWGIGGQVAYS